MACWKMRSFTVGIPSFRIPPSGIGNLHSSYRVGGVLSPSDSLDKFFLVFPQVCAYFLHGNPVDSWRSLVCLYSLKALLRLPFSSISSKSSGCALSLSFHIRRKERCALTYPSRSALSLCEQLSLFSVPNVLSSFPSCTKDSC